MGQVYTPAGPYRMNYGTIDMARSRIANRFGLAGMVGVEDPRGIPARGPTVVLPLVRGREGWFYLSDGKRAQDRGVRGLGDAAADYAAEAANYTVGSADYQFLMGCSQNPTAPACAADVTAVLSSPFLTASQEAAVRAAQASGALPQTYAPTTLTPTAAQLTPQEAATAVTGKPNQSVPPTDTSTPLPTGTGPAGGNPVLSAGVPAPAESSNNGMLLLLGVGVAALFLLGRH